MGVHQYHLTVIPNEAAAARLQREAQVWTEQPPLSFIEDLRQLLPKNNSWGGVEEFESVSQWGSDLRIWRDDAETHIKAVEFRYAPLGDRIDVLSRFLDLVSRHGFLLVARDSGRVIAPQIEAVVADLRRSSAYRFLSDPAGAILEGARKANPKD